MRNKRVANCCECGVELIPGDGTFWDEVRPPWSYGKGNYVCHVCYRNWREKWLAMRAVTIRSMEEIAYHIKRILPGARVEITNGSTAYMVVDQVSLAQGMVREIVYKDDRFADVARNMVVLLEELGEDEYPKTWQGMISIANEAEEIAGRVEAEVQYEK